MCTGLLRGKENHPARLSYADGGFLVVLKVKLFYRNGIRLVVLHKRRKRIIYLFKPAVKISACLRDNSAVLQRVEPAVFCFYNTVADNGISRIYAEDNHPSLSFLHK